MSKNDKLIKITYAIFVGLFLVMSLLPLVLFNPKQPSIGNEEKVSAPRLDDGTAIFSKFDAYFSRYFGERNRLVSLGNSLKRAVFRTSGQPSVIVGSDGWLFYESALGDYTGEAKLSAQELDRAAAVVSMMQTYVENQGKDFVFLIAPNKMSVYGEYMPYYYTKSSDTGNYDELYAGLDSLGVHSVALKRTFQADKLQGVKLYHKLDSHWNNYGAAIAYECVARSLNARYGEAYKDYTVFTECDRYAADNFRGDLEAMLVPGNGKKDEQVYFRLAKNIEYGDDFRSPEDMMIKTVQTEPAVNKRATLFRDSFGNALYYFFAYDYAEFVALRQATYNLYDAVNYSDMIAVELVERNIKNLLKYAPVMVSQNLVRDAFFNEKVKSMENRDDIEYCEVNAIVTKNAQGLYVLSGTIDNVPYNTAEFYICADGYIYRLIPGLGNGDFTLYCEDGGLIEELQKNKAGIMVVCGEQVWYAGANVTLQD